MGLLGSYGVCPSCGGQTIETAVAGECTECDYSVYYGGDYGGEDLDDE